MDLVKNQAIDNIRIQVEDQVKRKIHHLTKVRCLLFKPGNFLKF